MNGPRVRWIGVALALGLVGAFAGSGWLQRPAAAQQEAGRTSPLRFKYVPLGEGKTAETLWGAALHLEGQAIEGWEFCGSLDMSLRLSEYEALLAGHEPGGTTGQETEQVYRVLVFKQPARR